MHAPAQDLRFTLRQLRKAPGFALTVILTLALGIGSTTAIFSLVEGILLRPLPFADAGRLVVVGDHLAGNPSTPVTAREIATYSNASTAFSSLGGYMITSYELSGGATPEEINASRFTASVFPTLGVRPILGRVFSQQEEDAHEPLAVISYALWLTRFHRDPNILGAAIVLDRRPYTIIGVMPRSFEFPLEPGHLDQSQFWVPLSLTPDELSDEHAGHWGYLMVARMKDGVTLAQAKQDAARVAQQAMRNFPPGMSAIQIEGDASLLSEDDISDARPILRTLFCAVSIVLLIACVNVAGLLLVRAIRRRREHAVRLALGARSGVIIRESLIEGLVLSLAGGLLGLGFAAIVIRAALRLLPESMPRVDSISIDTTVGAFALLLAVFTGILCSLAPAFAALRTNLTENLKDGSRTGTGASSHTWLRSALVVSEIAIALVLLTVSGAFLRSFQKMRAIDPGFRADHVIVAQYQLPLDHYSTYAAASAFNRSVLDRLSSKPGVTAAGITTALPATDLSGGASYTIEGQPEASWKLKFSMFAMTDGDYFRALAVPLIQGRYFTADDRADSLPVIVVNQSMAQHSWPGQNAIGKRMHVGNPKKTTLPWATVVGIVADTKVGSSDQPNADQWYGPAAQPNILHGAAALGALPNSAGGFVAVRSALSSGTMIQTLRSAVGEIDPLLALQQVQTMDDVVANIEAPRRFNTDLITSFAADALVLAIVGIYAVVTFSVSLRTQEIAIRMALGAQRTSIVRLVLISGGRLALVGCGLGVLGSLAVSRLVNSFLFGVSATDPLIYIAAVLIMLLMTLLASAIPATRAASANPVVALRSI